MTTLPPSATSLEGAMPPIPDEMDSLSARVIIRAYPFQLGIYRPGEIASPEEIEAGHPCWFSAPRYAKAAGAALIARHSDTLGYDVTKVVDGHWRTVASVWKESR